MINVAGHLREQNGTYQMVLSWKDANGKRRTKSISTGLPVKGNKKRAESLLRQTQKEFNPETMQQVGDLSRILTVDTPTIWAGSSSRTLNESGCL